MIRTVLAAAIFLLMGSNMALAVNEPPRIISGRLVFTKQVIASDVDETHSVTAADLDGDDDLDVVATDYIDGQVFWYENDGAGGFLAHLLDGDLQGAYPSHVADVDLDGDTDVLACGYDADSVVWYENDGWGSFSRRDVDTAADGAHSVVTGDMDDDGDIDLLTTNQDAGTVTWYENDGNQGFTLHLIDDTAEGAKRAEFADIDGDQDLDVVAVSFFVNEIAWYRNDGNQNFSKLVIDSAVNGAYHAHPADIDGDGDLDVLTASQLDNSIRLFRNNGAGQFTGQIIDASAEGARGVIAADVDGDGDLDPISTSVDDNTVGWYENVGDGSFAQRAVDINAQAAYGSFAIDFDHDGDIDVLSASRDAFTVALHHQTRSHQAYLTDLGGTLLINATLLQTVDPDDLPAELTYRITDGPDSGELRVDGVGVPVGGAFTQDDIDYNRLTYVHDGASSFPDVFSFTVADGGEDGLKPVSGTFTIYLGGARLAHWLLDETSGPVAEDVVGGFDGNLVGDPVWQPGGGRLSGALELDGVDDLVDIGAIDFAGDAGMTVALWLRPQALNGDSRLISEAIGITEQDHYWMVSTYLDTRLRYRIKAGGETSTLITEQDELEIGEWYHVACTYDQNEMHIYGNGKLVASMPKTGMMDLNPLVTAAIGAQPPGAGSNNFTGMIDDVRLFNLALSQLEIAELVKPRALSGLTATQRKTGNGNDGTTGINLTWAPPTSEASSIEIWRKGFGDYPEFEDGTGAVPAMPVTIANGWELATTVPANSNTFADEPATRDFWYYAAKVIDANDNYSDTSNMTGGTLNYILGDVIDLVEPYNGVGDNLVDVTDISLLGANYNITLADPPPDFRAFLDVGPTIDNRPEGLPTTDNQVEFEDIIIFGLNFSLVSKDLFSPPPAATNAITLRVEEAGQAGDLLPVGISMSGNGQIQGLSVPLRWDSRVVEPVGVRAGDLLDLHGGMNLVLSPQPGVVDAVLCGVRQAGISGEGLLAVVDFRVKSGGDPGIELGEVHARDAANQEVFIDGAVVIDVPENSPPKYSFLNQAAPNPFNLATKVSFVLEVDGPVTLNVYSMGGQLVKTLVNSRLQAGTHELIWDGKNASDQVVSSGTYLLRLVAPDRTQSRKISVLK